MGFFERWRSPEVPKIEKKSEQQSPQEVPAPEQVNELRHSEGAVVERPEAPDAGLNAEHAAIESEKHYFERREFMGHHLQVGWDPEWECYSIVIPEMAPDAPDFMVRITEKESDARKVLMGATSYIERGYRGKRLYEALEQYIARELK